MRSIKSTSRPAVRNIVMAKYPTPGRVKTRLTPALSPAQAAHVQSVFIRHWGHRLARHTQGAHVFCVDPPESLNDFTKLLHPRWLRDLIPQQQGDLGARLIAAAAVVRAKDDLTGLMFLGVDSPDVPESTHVEAMQLVRAETVTIGLAGDGGFWCLGLGRGVDPGKVLVNIDWSSGREASQVVARARLAGYDVRHAGMWDDIDRPDDLRRLMRRLRNSRSGLDRSLYRSLRFLPRELQA